MRGVGWAWVSVRGQVVIEEQMRFAHSSSAKRESETRGEGELAHAALGGGAHEGKARANEDRTLLPPWGLATAQRRRRRRRRGEGTRKKTSREGRDEARRFAFLPRAVAHVFEKETEGKGLEGRVVCRQCARGRAGWMVVFLCYLAMALWCGLTAWSGQGFGLPLSLR